MVLDRVLLDTTLIIRKSHCVGVKSTFRPSQIMNFETHLQAEWAGLFCVAPPSEVLAAILLAARDGSSSIFHQHASKWNV